MLAKPTELMHPRMFDHAFEKIGSATLRRTARNPVDRTIVFRFDSARRCEYRVARDQTVYQIGGDRVLVMVFENDSSLGPPGGRSTVNSIRISPTPSFISSIAGISARRAGADTLSVDRNRQFVKHPLRVSALLGHRDDAVAVGVDARDYAEETATPGIRRMDAWIWSFPPRGWWLADIHRACARRYRSKREKNGDRGDQPGFHLRGELPAIVIRRIAVHGVDMQGGIAAEGLRCVFDDEVRALNAIIGGDVFSGGGGGWAAPGEPRFVDIGFYFGHAGGGGAFVNNARPLGYHIEQHGALLLVHCRGFQSFGLDGFAVLAGTEHQIGQAVAEDGLFFAETHRAR